MRATERDLTGWGWENAKARTKTRGRVPWRVKEGRGEVCQVDIHTVIEKARALFPELTVTPKNARKWVYAGLIPKPTKIRGLGRGAGVSGDYSQDSPAQMAAAAFAASRGYRQKEIAQARKLVLEGLRPDSPELEAAFAALAGDRDMFEVDNKARRIALAALTYAKALARARGGLPLEERWPEIRFIDKRSVAGDPNFCFYICLPGKMWDPRVTGDTRAVADAFKPWAHVEWCEGIPGDETTAVIVPTDD